MQTWLKSFESKFSEALEAFVCVCVKGTKIADMSGWVQKVHIHHPGESRAGSHSGPFRPSGRQNGRLAAAALQMCDWWPTNDKRTEEKKKQRALLLLERHRELLHLQRKWTFNRPTHTPTHAYARTQAGAHTYWTHTEMMFLRRLLLRRSRRPPTVALLLS